MKRTRRTPFGRAHPVILRTLTVALLLTICGVTYAWIDPRTGEFTYVEGSGIDDTLG